MEATFLAKRALFNIPKFLPHGPPGIQSTGRVARACFSSAFERAEGSNAAVEAASDPSDAPRDSYRDVMDETKHQAFATGEGRPPGSTTSFMADTAKDGVKKAVEAAENVGDTAKKTLDGAWMAAKDTAQSIKDNASTDHHENGHDDEIEEDVAVDEIREFDQPVDTQEYRIIEERKKLELNGVAH
ncbi:hypothetical protein CCACVL1_08086 [Corchorus capsularis]|uniref:Uncharacterized protein n=1 Tax=Corchorus capsularis TaxID=210143 RepID=A0A1R3J2D2_COCAP|nr:hypothetical protein CCACVL1_08086 [Corchorus capsularis]